MNLLPKLAVHLAILPPLVVSFQSIARNPTQHDRGLRLQLAGAPLDDMLRKLSPTPAVSENVALKFIEGFNANRISEALEVVDDNVEFEDTIFPGPFQGKVELERILRLQSKNTDRETIIVDQVANDTSAKKVGILFHTETADGLYGKKGAASFVLNFETGKIEKVFWVKESNKSGEANLKTLRAATALAGNLQSDDETIKTSSSSENDEESTDEISSPVSFFFPKPGSTASMTLPEKYFDAWNQRDMAKAASLFSEDCEYDDTAFPAPFVGKEALERHLNICADCFPSTFQFCVDDQIIGKEGNILVRWHVENDGQELFFTRGCSFYNIENNKIRKGTDFVEPAVFKTGSVTPSARAVASKLSAEPVRLIPLATWAAYMYIVFFSEWLYGLPATALEQRTWEEVLNLSLNFFLVSPILHLPFSPVVHPMLEGVFNLLLSWAALFAGFLSDDRPKKPNVLPYLPIVAGMQFLTSAFLLPYLVTRSNEYEEEVVYKEDLGPVAQATESRLLAPILSFVGTGSIFWGIFARADDFGGWNERLQSFVELLKIDRVGTSFLIDLAIFAAFQGWFVDDDVKRRGMDPASPLVAAAKFVPFFGLAAYLTFRD
eukprot:CAMPEP_0176034428 /NCGR_PEP_ID=MMETSP0120_2-20121206/17018_1 /TAXON_ID=160619 /ORGANISM="Kryptoperidinium foliaceum, Strain CCMP 1326" /LENGTH=605 /DNA_ID=CAMNT_0017367769 /DNA_START=292 /DNA_END=2106 /DNA_ORIENTATION=-